MGSFVLHGNRWWLVFPHLPYHQGTGPREVNSLCLNMNPLTWHRAKSRIVLPLERRRGNFAHCRFELN